MSKVRIPLTRRTVSTRAGYPITEMMSSHSVANLARVRNRYTANIAAMQSVHNG